MNNIILDNINPVEYLVTPLTPYFICNHFISTEIHNHPDNKSTNKIINKHIIYNI